MHVQHDVNKYNKNSIIQQNINMIKQLHPICRVSSYLCSNLRGNLHIVKGRDKLRELSRVPTCHTNMNASLNVLFIPFKILFFSCFSKLFTTMHLDLFYSYPFLFYKNSFLSGFLHTHTHTKMYDHSPQKHLINIQVMPLSPQSTTFFVFSRSLTDVHITSRRIP